LRCFDYAEWILQTEEVEEEEEEEKKKKKKKKKRTRVLQINLSLMGLKMFVSLQQLELQNQQE
jgi:hypothetical protein